MNLDYDGKTVLVTGGGSGIGSAIALATGKRGGRVVVADIDLTAAERTTEQIRQIGGYAVSVRCDVTSCSEVERLLHEAVSTLGSLDCAFNNAGTLGPAAPLADFSEGDWARVMDVNATSVFLCMKYEIRQMLLQGKGSIVNTASIAGLVGSRVSPAYAASKHAVVGLTKTAALQYAKAGIRINAVCPGSTKTAMVTTFFGSDSAQERALAALHPIGRLAEPSEIAEAALWLNSDSASFMVGNALAVDGGWVAQ